MDRTRLKQIIKEEVESVLFEDETPLEELKRFMDQLVGIFRSPADRRTLKIVMEDYDKLIDVLHDREEPLSLEDPRKIMDDLTGRDKDPINRQLWTMFKSVLQRTLVGVSVEALKRIPKSADAPYVKTALDRIANKEERKRKSDAERARELSPEEKAARRKAFGDRMSSGYYGKLD